MTAEGGGEGEDKGKERGREEVLKNLSISLINRYLQYLTKKAATFFPLLCFFFLYRVVRRAFNLICWRVL